MSSRRKHHMGVDRAGPGSLDRYPCRMTLAWSDITEGSPAGAGPDGNVVFWFFFFFCVSLPLVGASAFRCISSRGAEPGREKGYNPWEAGKQRWEGGGMSELNHRIHTARHR